MENVEAEEATDVSPKFLQKERGKGESIPHSGWHVNFIVSGDRRGGKGELEDVNARDITRLVERVKMNICKSLSNLRADSRASFHDGH